MLMSISKKHILLTLLVLMLTVCLLAGCTGGSDNGGNGGNSTTEGTTAPDSTTAPGSTTAPIDPDSTTTAPSACEHSFGEWMVKTAPTCTEAGERVALCQLCGAEKSETIETIGHDYQVPVFLWQEGENGYTAQLSVACAADPAHTVVIDATIAVSSMTDATACENGEMVYLATAIFEEQEYTEEKAVVLSASHPLVRVGEGTAEGHEYLCACGQVSELRPHVEAEQAKITTVTAPTCEEEGLDVHTYCCSDCGYALRSEEVAVEATGHRWYFYRQQFAQAEDGEYYLTVTCRCSNNNQHSYDEVVKATYRVSVQPGCTSKGTGIYSASVMINGYTYKDSVREDIPAVGHSWYLKTFLVQGDENSQTARAYIGCANNSNHDVACLAEILEVDVVPATCTVDGSLTCQLRCTYEGQTYTGEKMVAIPAYSHDITDVEPVIDEGRPATCCESGAYAELYYCKVCQELAKSVTKHTPVDPNAHNYKVKFNWKANDATVWVVSATLTCQHNTSHRTTQSNLPLELVHVDATCTEYGSDTYTASVTVNGLTYYDYKTTEIAPGHKWNETFLYNETHHWMGCDNCDSRLINTTHILETKKHDYVYPSCMEEGSCIQTTSCKYCNYSYDETLVLEKEDHRAGTAVREEGPDSTCTTAGSYDMVTSCRYCGVEMTRVTYQKPLAAHTLTETVITPPTCGVNGEKEISCEICTYRETAPIAALSHSYESGACIHCGAVKESEGLDFAPVDGGYALSGLGNCSDAVVVVPSYVNGLPVTTITASAFKDNLHITEIRFSPYVTHIEAEAFSGCINLRHVYFSEGLLTIGTSAFQGCSALEEIILPDSVTTVGASAFSGASAVRRIVIGEGVTAIGNNAFVGAYYLESLEYNAINCTDYCTSYATSYSAFRCAGSKGEGFDLVIGASVQVIPSFFLYGDSSVDGDNYDRQCVVKSVTFEENSSLTFIGEQAFRCVYVGHVTLHIPASVTTVEQFAFSDMFSYFENYQQKTKIYDITILIEGENPQWVYSSCLNGPIFQATFSEYYSKINYVLNATGETFTDENGLRYAVLNDGTLALYGTNNKELTELRVPTAVNGKTVTAISVSAFYNISTLDFVEIPETINTIGIHAFFGCKLKTLIYRAPNLQYDITLKQSCGALANGANIYIAANVESIPAYIFSENSSYNVYFEKGSQCSSIGEAAFSGVNVLVLPALEKLDARISNYTTINTVCFSASETEAQALLSQLGSSVKNIYYYTDSSTPAAGQWTYGEDNFTPVFGN